MVEHGEREHTSGRPSVSRVRSTLEAIERLAAVDIDFLDASSNLCDLSDSGELTPRPDSKAILSAAILQTAVRTPRPIVHSAVNGALSVAVPFIIKGRLAGFIEASGLYLDSADQAVREKMKSRFIVASLPGGPPVGAKPVEWDVFRAVVDLLEAAAAELTFLEAMAEAPATKVPGDTEEPLAWQLWSYLEEMSAEASGAAGVEVSEAREQLEALYDSTQYGILMLDADRKIVAANKVFGQIFGTEPQAFIGVSAEWLRRWVIKHAADGERARAIIDELLGDPSAVFDDELDLVTPEPRILRIFSSPMKNRAGESMGRVFMFRDITEFRRARHEMIGAEKMTAIGRVAAGLAHGLNNILAGVVTYADFALDSGESDRIRDALRMSLAAAEKASELVNKLLVVSGASESMRQDVDLHIELERLLDSLKEDFSRRGIRVHRLLEPVPRVNVDPVQMQQAFRNILENAAQASGEDGTITVRTGTDWDSATVRATISDSGPGIPDELLDRIFDPFFTTKGVVSGGGDTAAAGLGLSITRGIIEQNGGKVAVTHAKPHGATFVIQLPLPAAASEAPPSPSLY
ncbi:MAG: two-component system sensor histidine kinase NtrB [Planctomycetota bacterium]|jgi:PAS domain S-box-containing protein